MTPRWHSRWRALALSLDVVFIGGALCAWTAARFGLASIGRAFVPTHAQSFAKAPLAFALPAWLLVFAAVRLYSPRRCQTGIEEGRRLVMAGPGAAVALVLLGFLVKDNPARSWLVGAMVIGTLGAAIGRQTLHSIVGRIRQRGRWTTRTVFVGREEAKRFVETCASDTAIGIEPVGTCGFHWNDLPEWDIGDVAEAVLVTNASGVMVVSEDLERGEVRAVVEVADERPLNVVVIPGLDYLLLGSLRLVTVGYEPGLALDAPSLHRYQAFIKRMMDICASATLMLLTSPVLAVCAIAIRLDSRGSAFFRHKRVGYRGQTFEVLKFRTMRPCMDHGEGDLPPDGAVFYPKQSADARTTRIGRVLRRTSLDELPQLWNVLRGDMSLVGPRPLSVWEAKQLDLSRRLVVRPGLTGLWQVSGRSTLSADERVRLDLVYVQNWSLLLDLSILMRTVPAVVGGKGAF